MPIVRTYPYILPGMAANLDTRKAHLTQPPPGGVFLPAIPTKTRHDIREILKSISNTLQTATLPRNMAAFFYGAVHD